jgi:rare lipoprotein A (RlpA)-like double-psi beta-barrel protein
MKRRAILRRRRLPRAALVLPMLTIPAAGAGLAYAASPQAAGAGSQNVIAASVKQRRVPYGQDLTVTGQAPSGEEGKTVQLLFQRAGGSDWRRIDSARIGRHDGFSFHTQLRWSGAVKVTGSWRRAAAHTGSTTAVPAAQDTSGTTHAASSAHRVTVVAVLHVGRHAGRDMGDRRLTVPGTILPRARGRQIRLEAYSGHGWHTAAVARTGSQGRFRLNFTPHSRTEWLRVRFGGNQSNAAAGRRAGRVTVFSQSTASWYDDGGATACGFHATYGVANLSLPCGTKVTFVYNGRSVTATVDDRGPYVGGREWDLNQNTAGALGFGGVANVWASR